MNIQNLIPKGEWKSTGEYVIRCPFCGDSKSHNHCHINVIEKIFHCFFCGEGGHLGKLFRKLGLDLPTEPHDRVPLERTPVDTLDFEQFQPLWADMNPHASMARDYLQKRGFSIEEIREYDLRITHSTDNKWYGRVLFPVKEEERIVCTVGRAYLEFIQPKYLYPHRGETLLTAGESLYAPAGMNPGPMKSITLVEGVFDAISVVRNLFPETLPIALLGKILKEPQLYKILKYPENIDITVMLDADAPEDNLRVAKQLSAYNRPVWVATIKGGDPASVPPEEVERAWRFSQRFSFDLEMEMKLGRM